MNTCSTVKHANFLWRRHGSLFKMKDVKKAKRESLVGVLFTTFFYQTFKTQTKLAWLAKIIFLNIHTQKNTYTRLPANLSYDQANATQLWALFVAIYAVSDCGGGFRGWSSWVSFRWRASRRKGKQKRSLKANCETQSDFTRDLIQPVVQSYLNLSLFIDMS